MFFDQEDFFLASPTLELFFSRNCVADVAEGFDVDEFGRVIGLREAGDEFLFVLHYAAVEMIGNADVENAGSAGHDVNVENHWCASLTGIGKLAIEERSLHSVARHANPACKKKPGYSGRDDKIRESRLEASVTKWRSADLKIGRYDTRFRCRSVGGAAIEEGTIYRAPTQAGHKLEGGLKSCPYAGPHNTYKDTERVQAEANDKRPAADGGRYNSERNKEPI